MLTIEMMILLPRSWSGTSRTVDFDIAIIDQASQITEPCALMPLVERIKTAMMVGDLFVHHSSFFFK